MSEISTKDFLDFHGGVVKDRYGTPLARLREEEDYVSVRRLPACSLGMYFHILTVLHERGIDAR